MLELKGAAACAGLALGPVQLVRRRYSSIGRIVLEPEVELERFRQAVRTAQNEITQLSAHASGKDKEIFTFHRELLADSWMLSEVQGYIMAGAGAAAAAEWAQSVYTARMREITDEYFSQRAGDIQDAFRRVVDILDGRPRQQLALTRPCVLVAEELLPSDIVSVDRSLVRGIVLSGGSLQSHVSIIARTFGIPCVVQVGPKLWETPPREGALCAMDGGSGLAVLEPDEATQARYAHRLRMARRRSLSLEKLKAQPCITRDGVQFTLMANCSGPQDVTWALERGAQGVGLVRSEFLFMGGKVPGEAQQLAFYRECVQAAAGRPITIRTLDIGADKGVAGLNQREDNPALGLRGLRFSLAHPDLFGAQLRALLQAGLAGPLRVMFPMVCTPQDLDRALGAVRAAKKELRRRQKPFSDKVPFGIMVETPAAVLCAEELAKKAAFFSIGTNDLTQYVHAADRVNPAVQEYYDPASPQILRLIRMACESADAAGIDLSVCGESAADPNTAALYLRAGVRKLSMAAPSVLPVKERLLGETIHLP